MWTRGHACWLCETQVELFIGNLSEQWEDDTAFHAAMQEYGTVERMAVIRNPEGVSKARPPPPLIAHARACASAKCWCLAVLRLDASWCISIHLPDN